MLWYGDHRLPAAFLAGTVRHNDAVYAAITAGDDCYYTSNACNPMIQTVNWCFTVGGQSGSAIYDLSDYSVVGILSGGPNSGPYFQEYSVWTPIDAVHFTTLTRWMWTAGTPVAVAPLAPPLAPAVQVPYIPERCKHTRCSTVAVQVNGMCIQNHDRVSIK